MPAITLRHGSTGAGVLQLQQLLNTSLQHRRPLRTDGYYGPDTEAAVRLYQSSVGLTVDGVAGPDTWRALEKRLGRKQVPSPVSKAFNNAPWMAIAMRAVGGVTVATEGPPTGIRTNIATPVGHSDSEAGGAPWIDLAMRELGQEEIPGPVANPRILEYHATTTLRSRSDETPWCSSFVNWCMQQAGLSGTKSAAAISWMHWGKPCTAIPGAITIISNRRAAGSNLTASGYHVGFLIEEVTSHVRLLGGNQGNHVKVSNFSKATWQIVDYRWPSP